MGIALINESLLTDIADAIRDKNGETERYTPSEMAEAISNIQTGSNPMLQDKTVAPREYDTTITPDDGYDGLSSVKVFGISPTYIGSGIAQRDSSDVTSVNGLITTPAGYYDTKVETQLTTQGAQTITPGTANQVIQSGRYLTGNQTILGDANLIAANILSGVTIFGVTGSASGGSSGLVYESGSWTPTSNVTNTTITWSGTHTSAPMMFMLMDSTGTTNTTTNTCFGLTYSDYYKIGGRWSYSSSSTRYGSVFIVYRGTSTSQTTYAGVTFTYPSTNTGASSTSYPRYWANQTRFYVYSNGTSRYWRSGRTYNWVAIWAPGES